MEAIVWTKYGPQDGLQLQEVAKPTLNDNEVLTKICDAKHKFWGEKKSS